MEESCMHFIVQHINLWKHIPFARFAWLFSQICLAIFTFGHVLNVALCTVKRTPKNICECHARTDVHHFEYFSNVLICDGTLSAHSTQCPAENVRLMFEQEKLSCCYAYANHKFKTFISCTHTLQRCRKYFSHFSYLSSEHVCSECSFTIHWTFNAPKNLISKPFSFKAYSSAKFCFNKLVSVVNYGKRLFTLNTFYFGVVRCLFYRWK